MPTDQPQRRAWLTTGVIIGGFVVVAAALLVFFQLDLGFRDTLIAAAVAVVPLLVVVPVFLWVDRMEAEPPRYVLFAFFWGALCAALGALLLNTGIHLLILATGMGDADTLGAVIGAPVIEESLKGAAIALIAWRRRREFDGVIDGIVYAGMAGAGFAFSENILYLGRALELAGTAGLSEVFFLRCLLGPFAHPLFTACTGIGIGLAVTVARSGLARVAFACSGLLAAVLLHGVWNLSAATGMYVQVYLAFQMPVFAVFLVMLVVLRQREQGLIQRHLSEYADAGWLSTPEVAMVASVAARRSARRWARERGGLAAARAMRAFQDQAGALALLRSRIVRGSAPADALVHERELLEALSAHRSTLATTAVAAMGRAPWPADGVGERGIH